MSSYGTLSFAKRHLLILTSLFLVAGAFVGPSGPAYASDASGLNQWARDGKLAFKVTAIHCGQKSFKSDDGFQTDTAQGVFCVVSITIKNIGTQAQTPDDSAQFLYDTEGRQYTADSSADIDLNTSSIWQFTSLNPGLSISGTLYYDVPAGTHIASLQVHDSSFSDGATINLEDASLGPWIRDKVIDGMLALNFVTEELDTTCVKGVSTFGLVPTSLLKAYGENGQLLLSVQLGKTSVGSDRNAKGKKVRTCNFATQIWIPLNQSKYTFKWSVSSDGKSVVSSAFMHKVQKDGFSMYSVLSVS